MAMRYVTAFLGAAFIFVATFILSAVLIGWFVPALAFPLSLGGPIATNHPVEFVIATLAALSSFTATIRRGRKNKPTTATKVEQQPPLPTPPSRPTKSHG